MSYFCAFLFRNALCRAKTIFHSPGHSQDQHAGVAAQVPGGVQPAGDAPQPVEVGVQLVQPVAPVMPLVMPPVIDVDALPLHAAAISPLQKELDHATNMRLLLESKVKELEKHERLLKFEMRLRAHQPPAPTTAAAAVEPAVGIVPVAPLWLYLDTSSSSCPSKTSSTSC
jgi:hypothetical protein